MPAFLIKLMVGPFAHKMLKWAVYNLMLPQMDKLIDDPEHEFDDKIKAGFHYAADLYFGTEQDKK